jgi:threonine/homoserine/homoserine lactone efflux protein
MPLHTWLIFVPACFALNMAFGPNNLLALTNAARGGALRAIIAAQGRNLAFAVMIAITAVGLGALLAASAAAFTVIKVIGAAYLFYLGIRLLLARAPSIIALDSAPPKSLWQLAGQEFWVAIGNPKAILIFTAFFPQFIVPEHYSASFLIMGVTFLMLEVVSIALYALLGARLGPFMRQPATLRWFNRVSGSMMMAFGLGLLLARRPSA